MVKIVGILNVTPDSFSDGGKFFKTNDAVKQAEKLIEEGADIIDIGGESTRPGSKPVPIEEEIKRVVPVIKEIKKKIPGIPVSVDTYKPEVALKAIDEGCEIVNDIYGMRWQDGEMASIVAKNNVKVVIMHMQGTPQTMQTNPQYKNVISDIKQFFSLQIKFAESKGIKKEKIIIDPGIGFGKTLQHNLQILKKLNQFKELNQPIMVGPSRKSFIGTLLNVDVSQRLEGTIASVLISVINGADYLRVHDVLSVKRAITVLEAICDYV
ncbi:MAG: dihydropteroate synthase [Elusimicrobiota bacterium]